MSDRKYPWSKRRDSAASGVYAGPDYFAKDTGMNDVYAGPEFFEKNGDEPDEPVTADEIEENAPENAPLPEALPPRERFMCVYAGPEFFEKNGDEPDEPIDLPTDGPDTDGAAPSDADAPAVDNAPDAPTAENAPDGTPLPPSPDQMFMCVYAGPDYFSNTTPAGAFGPPISPEQQTPPAALDDPDKIFCPNCGMPIYKGKFCSECGAILPQSEDQ